MTIIQLCNNILFSSVLRKNKTTTIKNVFRYQYQQRKEGLIPRTPENLFSPQKIRCHHPKCPKMLSNHCGSGNSVRGSANKLTNLQEQSKTSNNQLNHDDILSDNSEIQSLNNTLSATMDEKQKMLLLKIANNSIAAASAVADNDYGNVSYFTLLLFYVIFFPLLRNSLVDFSFLFIYYLHFLHFKLSHYIYISTFHSHFNFFFAQQNSASSSLLSPPTSTRRRGSSVMFNEFVILHTPPKIEPPQNDKNTLSAEKMTQTGDTGTGIWQVSILFPSTHHFAAREM